MNKPQYFLQQNKLFTIKKFITPSNAQIKAIALRINSRCNNLIKGCFDFVSLRIRYQTDIQHYGVIEYWSFPIETLKRGIGDCEDTSFLLASLLLAAGVNPKNVRVVLGKTSGGGHAWVEVRTDKGWYILESTSDVPLEYGMNTWKIRDGYKTGYSPHLYIYRDHCVKIGNR